MIASAPASVFTPCLAPYQPHPLHSQDRNWAETNCYVDVWIELLHAWGFDPVAAMPFAIGIDFEGDQWTFFKFSLGDLRELYGLDVQELAIWRPLVSHVAEQVDLGRAVLVELDSYYLPDTAGTAYKRQHQKTTVAAVQIDLERQRMGYFHGPGYHELEGEDFVQLFRLESPPDPAYLPPYVEFVKRRPGEALTGTTLVQASVGIFRRHLRLLPEKNPFTAFKVRFERDLNWLTSCSLDVFHQYSFATLRQFGASYELAANYLKWLQRNGVDDFAEPIAGLTALSTGAKTLQFQLARAMARKKLLNLSIIDDLAATWSTTVHELQSRSL